MTISGLRGSLFLGAALALLPVASLRAQFEEPDTVPRFGIGPLVELTFRGERGTARAADVHVGFSNGPAFGGALQFRFSRTGALQLTGSYGAASEEDRIGKTTQIFKDLKIIQGTAELLFKLKASVPGYFILGGGARRVDPEDCDQCGFFKNAAFTERLLILGAGLNFDITRHDLFRVTGRYYLAFPPDELAEAGDMKAVASDFGLGFSYLRRF